MLQLHLVSDREFILPSSNAHKSVNAIQLELLCNLKFISYRGLNSILSGHFLESFYAMIVHNLGPLRTS